MSPKTNRIAVARRTPLSYKGLSPVCTLHVARRLRILLPPRVTERARLDKEVTRLATAIAAGGDLAALLAALQERERRRSQIRAELATLGRLAKRDAVDTRGVLDQLRESLTDWQGMLRQETPEARRALRALLAGRLVFTPRGEGEDRYYDFEGPGTVSRVIAGLVLPKSVVTPAGPDRFRLTVPLRTVYRRAA